MRSSMSKAAKRLSPLLVLAPLSLACDNDPATEAPGPDAAETRAAETTEETAEPVAEETAELEATVEVGEPLPYLMSRYGPTQGLPGIWVTILTAFDSRGCSAAGTCRVTINGVPATIASDEYTLDIIVPPSATTGPLCVTWHDRTECGEDFTVLSAPLLYAVYPNSVYAGTRDIALSVTGDGFMTDSVILFQGARLETQHISSYELAAQLPAALFETAGTRTVSVLSPSLARCGVQSEPVEFTILE